MTQIHPTLPFHWAAGMAVQGRTWPPGSRTGKDPFRRHPLIPFHRSEGLLSLRVFGRLPFTGVRGRTEAGVGKADLTQGRIALRDASAETKFAAVATQAAISLPASSRIAIAILTARSAGS